MAQATKTSKPADAEVEVEGEAFEDRLDEFALTQFGHLGYSGRFPDSLVETYKAFKKVKDKLQPGRLSPEGFAMVVVLADLAG